MPYTISGKAVMLRQLAAAISHIGLHAGIPAASNEIAGGGYERQRVEFAEPFGGKIRANDIEAFRILEGSEVTHAGFWTGPSGGVLLAYCDVGDVKFSGNGLYVVDAASLDLNLEEDDKEP